MRFTDTITVYNMIPQRGRNPPGIRRTVVRGVFWDAAYGTAFGRRGADNADRVLVMIPDRPECLPEREWFGQECPADRFTLRGGDIIARGEHGDISSAADLGALYAEFVVITEVRDCRYGSKAMRHWEVSGK